MTIRNSSYLNRLYLSVLVMLGLMVAGCAIIVAPSGGPKDETPPVVVRSEPAARAVHFHGNRISIQFNEFVKLNNIEKYFLVSPPLSKDPEMKIKGHSLLIKLKDTLRSNTTYNFYFGDAIVDITEQNPIANYSFAFSTGPTIDSLSLNGRVTDAFERKPVKDVLVMLYTDFSDSVPAKQLPMYVSRTNEKGHFCLDNLAGGKYCMVALKDGNSDFLYNLPSEMIGFSNDSVMPTYKEPASPDSMALALAGISGPNGIEISLFPEPDSIQRIGKCVMATANRMMTTFRYATRNAEIRPLNLESSSLWSIREWNTTLDTLNTWLLQKPDTLKLQISDNGLPLDTVKLSTTPKTSGKSKDAQPDNRLKFTSSLSGRSLTPGNKLQLTFDNPVKSCNLHEIRLFRKNGQDTLVPEAVFTDSLRRHMQINFNWLSEEEYTLYLPKSSFTDIYDFMNDSTVLKFVIRPREEFGSFAINIKSNTGKFPIIVQLTTEKGLVLAQKTIYSGERADFGLLLPGKYGLKAILDKNSNGKWDTGVFLRKLQPETIQIHPRLFEVHANWELEEDWTL